MTQSETILTVFCFLTIYFAVCWPIGFLADQRGRNFFRLDYIEYDLQPHNRVHTYISFWRNGREA